MVDGPGGWFVRTGCYTCHPVSALGVNSPTPIGPDLSTAADDTERRYGKTIEEFVNRPEGLMRAVFARQFMLTPAQKADAVRQLRARLPGTSPASSIDVEAEWPGIGPPWGLASASP